MKTKLKISIVLLTIFFICLSVIFFFPLFYLVLASLQPVKDIFSNGIRFFSSDMGLQNYQLLKDYRDGIYFNWYINSVIITACFTIISLVLSSTVGYGLGMYDFKGKNLLFVLVLIVMMIPLEILMLPLFQLIIKLKIVDTYAGVILPFVVSPLAIFFFRQFVSGLPKDFLDAGRVDGCTEFGIYVKIMVPLMKPAYGAMAILLAMSNWNSFVWPLLALRSNKMFTIPVGLASLINPYGSNTDILIAGAVVAIIPIIILFFVNQRFFISGLAAGGIKG